MPIKLLKRQGTKMIFRELKDMYPPPPIHYVSPDGLEDKSDRTHWGSKKNVRHAHKPAYRPHRANIIPAEYRRRHLGLKRVAKNSR